MSKWKTIQKTIPIEEILENGVFKVRGNLYSKMYRFDDSNFAIEPEETQEKMIERYEQLISHFPDNVSLELVFINRKMLASEVKKRYHLASKDDNKEKYRECYNHIIDVKIENGRNDISKAKYVLVTATIKDAREVQSQFSTYGSELDSAMKDLNKTGVTALTALERLELIDYYYKGIHVAPFKDRAGRYSEDGKYDPKKVKRMSATARDIVAPAMMKKAGKGNSYIQLGEKRYARSFMVTELPPSLDTSYISKATSVPCEMVMTVHFAMTPRDKAEKTVRRLNNSIKAEIQKNSKTAVKSGLDPQYTLSESLLEGRDEATDLRREVVRDKKRVFYVTASTTIFAETEDDMKDFSSQFVGKNSDFSLVPNPLDGQQIAGLSHNALTGLKVLSRDIMLVSSSAVALFPLNIQEIQDGKGRFYGTNAFSGNMIMFNRRDSDLPNGFIFGRAGSGKSYFAKGEDIPNILGTNDDFIFIDPDAEYVALAKEFGGVVVDLRRKSEFHINPMDMDMEWDDREADPLAEKCEFMVSLIESIFHDGRECNPMEVSCIHRVTQEVYSDYMSYMNLLHENGSDKTIDTEQCPTLADFYNGLLRDGSIEANKLALILEPYCSPNGQYNLFAHKTNVTGDSRILVYVTKHLPDKMKTFAMKVCFSDMWTKLCKNKGEKATWIKIDEAYMLMQTSASATTLQTYYKRCRKYHGIMTCITQDITDALLTYQGQAMLENSAFVVFMNQSPTGRERIQQRYKVPDSLMDYTNDKGVGKGLIYTGRTITPFDYTLPTDTVLHKLMTTKPSEEEEAEEKKEA